MTEPPVEIGYCKGWEKVVSFDPWGHLVQEIWKDEINKGLDVRPSIAVTKAVSTSALGRNTFKLKFIPVKYSISKCRK
jgi:hypothetical protein